MKKLFKILKYTLIVAGFAFVILVVIGNIISHYFTYHEVDDLLLRSKYNMYYFKKTAVEKISVKTLYKDVFKDSIYILRYTDSCKIVVLIIGKNNDAYFGKNIDTFQVELKAEQVVGYTAMSLGDIELDLKTFPYEFKSILIHFNTYCKNIQPLITNDYCQYYHLKAGRVYFSSDDHSYYDFYLGLNNSNYSDFMAFTMNHKLYVVALYSTQGKDISPDALLNIMNVPVK